MQHATGLDTIRREPYEVVLRSNESWLSLDLREIWQYRDLLSLLVWRDFVSKYKQTILGPLWFVLQPLCITVVFTVVFGTIAGLSTDGLPPMLFYLCGQLGWNYFAQSLSGNAATFVSNASLFGKVYFPRLIVPLASLVTNFLTFGIQVGVFAMFFAYFKYLRQVPDLSVSPRLALLPLLLLQTAALSLGVALVLSAVTAKYRDLTQVTALLLQIWMYATPVIFPLSKFPVQWRWVAALNPMTPVIESYRLLLLGRGTVQPFDLALSVTMTTTILIVGVLLFGRVERTFIDIV